MAKWSVALFGFEKPQYRVCRIHQLDERSSIKLIQAELVTEPAKEEIEMYGADSFVEEIEGWAERAKPGDIVGAKPIPEFKVDAKGNLIEFSHLDFWTPKERSENLIVEIDGLESGQIAGLCEPLWDTNSYSVYEEYFLQGEETFELRPRSYLAKRRFNIPVSDLQKKGVDLSQMKDKKTEYAPTGLAFVKTEVYDKLKAAYVTPDAGLNPIKPVKIGKEA